MPACITDTQWAAYQRDGFLRLGQLLSDEELTALQDRIDAIMLGTAPTDTDRLMMQLDSADGVYDAAGAQTLGHKGATLGYRKIQELEHDPLFLAFMQRPEFRDMCARVYGVDTTIASFRAMFMNKPSGKGTVLPFHQDRWRFLDRDPELTLWTALDPANEANGCVQVVPGSHRYGLINPAHGSGFLTDAQVATYAPPERRIHLEAEAGEVIMMHNRLLHGSDVNRSDRSRRAFSVCYMDARTRADDGRPFPVIFGPGALRPTDVSTATDGAPS